MCRACSFLCRCLQWRRRYSAIARVPGDRFHDHRTSTSTDNPPAFLATRSQGIGSNSYKYALNTHLPLPSLLNLSHTITPMLLSLLVHIITRHQIGNIGTVTLVSAIGLSRCTRATTKEDYVDHAVDATDVLNSNWWNSTDGQWQGLWWNSANVITTLGNFANLDIAKFLPVAKYHFETSLVAAPASNRGSLLNEFYDDDGWWALSWIRAFDLTGNWTYLGAANDFFADLRSGEGGNLWGPLVEEGSLE